MSFPGGSYDGRKAGNTPLWSLGSALLLFVFASFLVIFADKEDDQYVFLLVGLVLTAIPSLIASAFSERASRDIRNGVVIDKVTEALENTGVAKVARESQRLTDITDKESDNDGR